MQRISVAVIAVLVTVASPGRGQEPVDAPAGTGGPRFLVASSDSRHRVEVAPSTMPVLRRRVSLAVDQVPVSGVLERIGRQLDVRFSYDPALSELGRQLTVRFDRLTLAAVLTEVLFETGLDVLVADRGHLALVPRAAARASRAGMIVGRATDAKSGQSLAAVDVFLDRTKWRAVTDSAGRYSLAGVDPGAYTLIARRLGYAKQSRKVVVDDGRTDTVHVALEAAAVPLDELVTTATGQQRRRDLGNAITTIKADSVLRSAPIRNLTDLLANRVPGLTVQHTSGAPGDPARLRLRGIGSVLRSNDPVVVVDGVRVYATQSDARSGNLTNALLPLTNALLPSDGQPVAAPSPLDQIDPNIIDKIEVFKGPSAATLYGADAANGVIVITTKKGKPGPTRWNASIELGRTRTLGRYPTGYYRWAHNPFNSFYRYFCPITDMTCVQDSLVQFQALNVPSLSVLGQGHRTAASLTASGGTQALTYSVTGSYENEIGLLKLPEFEVERFRTTFNREAPDWMRRPHEFTDWHVQSNVSARLGATADVTLSASLGRDIQQRTALENQLAPMAGTYVDTINKVYYRALPGAGLLPALAVLQDYYMRATASSTNFTTGLSANWRPLPWFNATGQAGVNIIPRDDQRSLPSGLASRTDSGYFSRATGQSLVSTVNLQGTARRPLPWGFVFMTNIGANLKTESTADVGAAASGLVPGTSTVTGATRVSAFDARTSTSVFGWYLEPQITGQRFSLSTGIRLDGGSTYGAHLTRTGGLFGGLLGLPKLSGSWVISEERWFPFQAFFSSLRLRGAYGQAQVQPGPSDRLRLYKYSVLGDPSVELTTLGNTQLRPERSTEFEGGFDADLLDSRLSLEFTTYRKTQVDALMPVTLPGSVGGGGSVLTNIGTIRNTGVELTLRAAPVRSRTLTWSSELSYSSNRNDLVELGRGVSANYVTGIVAGYPLGGRWDRPILGYNDIGGDGVLHEAEIIVGDSAVFMGRLYPAYQMTLHSGVTLLNGAVGVTAGFSYDAGATQVDQPGRINWVLSRALVDPATPLRQQAAALMSNLPGGTDYGVIQEVSTFRFNTLSVNYRAPAAVARTLRARELFIALQGSNLALHSTYRGKDPDVNAWGPGEGIVDSGQLAQPTTWQLRVDLNY